MKQLFSVIIPVYNARNWLFPCLDSICSQTFQYWEAILIDDGSQDGSDIICDAYAHRDSRFQVIHQRNKGVSVARNIGLSHVTGQYLLFVDADDLLLSNALQVLADYIEQKPECDIVKFGYQEDERKFCAEKNFLGSSNDFFACGFLPPRTVWGSLFSVKLAREMKFSEGISVGEDTEYSVKCYCRAKYLSVIPEILYVYRINTSSVMHSNITEDKVNSILKVINHLSLTLVPRTETEIYIKEIILEQFRVSFYHFLCRLEGNHKKLLSEYRNQKFASSRYFLSLRFADFFPNIYCLYLKYYRHLS